MEIQEGAEGVEAAVIPSAGRLRLRGGGDREWEEMHFFLIYLRVVAENLLFG